MRLEKGLAINELSSFCRKQKSFLYSTQEPSPPPGVGQSLIHFLIASYHQSVFPSLNSSVLYKHLPDVMPITLLSFILPANPVGRVQDLVHVVMLDE